MGSFNREIRQIYEQLEEYLAAKERKERKK